MPVELDWLDDDLRIIAIRFYPPFGEEDSDLLKNDVQPLLESDNPFFILVDLRETKNLDAFSQLATSLQDTALPSTTSPVANSKIAVVGGGPLVSMILSVAGQSSDFPNLIKHFKHEDLALSWLHDHAVAASNSS